MPADTGHTLEDRTGIVDRPPRQRSARTNQPLRGRVNGRTATGRRIGDLFRGYLKHMSNSNDPILQANALHAAELTVALEQARLAAARGEAVDVDQLVRLSNLVARAEKRLGIKPAAARPAVPTLAEHLARRAAERAQTGCGARSRDFRGRDMT